MPAFDDVLEDYRDALVYVSVNCLELVAVYLIFSEGSDDLKARVAWNHFVLRTDREEKGRSIE